MHSDQLTLHGSIGDARFQPRVLRATSAIAMTCPPKCHRCQSCASLHPSLLAEVSAFVVGCCSPRESAVACVLAVPDLLLLFESPPAGASAVLQNNARRQSHSCGLLEGHCIPSDCSARTYSRCETSFSKNSPASFCMKISCCIFSTLHATTKGLQTCRVFDGIGVQGRQALARAASYLGSKYFILPCAR